MIDNLKLPKISKQKEFALPIMLPYNGTVVQERMLSFSFSCFDRTHELFNLGGNTDEGVVSGRWFLDLCDCLKSVSGKKVDELKISIHDLHPVDWKKANADKPENAEQYEYWQFRINKTKGRVIGIIIQDIFYVVWFDPHHNLTDSVHYGSVNWYKPGKSEYELQQELIEKLMEENKIYKDLFDKV